MGRQSIKNQRRKYSLDKTELSAITTYFFELFSYSERTKKKTFFNATFNPAREDTAHCYNFLSSSRKTTSRRNTTSTRSLEQVEHILYNNHFFAQSSKLKEVDGAIILCSWARHLNASPYPGV